MRRHTFLFLSTRGELLSIAQRVQEEGHTAHFYSHTPHIGTGLLENIVKSVPEGMSCNPDVVVTDNPFMLHKGFVQDNVVGGNVWAASILENQLYAQQLLTIAGIPFMSKQEVSDLDTAVHIEVGVWWDGIRIRVPHIAFVNTRLLPGNIYRSIRGLGPEAGCTGVIVTTFTKQPKLVHETFGKIEYGLKEADYKGPMYLSLVATPTELYVTEFSPQFRFDLVQTVLSGLPTHPKSHCRIGDFLMNIVNGNHVNASFRNKWHIGVRMSLAPYPAKVDNCQLRDVKVGKVHDDQAKYLWWSDVYRDGENYLCAGNNGVVGCATGGAGSFPLARKRAQTTLASLENNELQYRTDIGAAMEPGADRLLVPKDYAALEQWGWLDTEGR